MKVVSEGRGDIVVSYQDPTYALTTATVAVRIKSSGEGVEVVVDSGNWKRSIDLADFDVAALAAALAVYSVPSAA